MRTDGSTTTTLLLATCVTASLSAGCDDEPPRLWATGIGAMLAVTACAADSSRQVDAKPEGITADKKLEATGSKWNTPPDPALEHVRPMTEAEREARRAEEACDSEEALAPNARLEARMSRTDVEIDGLGQYRMRTPELDADRSTFGLALALEGRFPLDRAKALWCEAIEQWRILVPTPSECNEYVADYGFCTLAAHSGEVSREIRFDGLSCPDDFPDSHIVELMVGDLARTSQLVEAAVSAGRRMMERCGLGPADPEPVDIRFDATTGTSVAGDALGPAERRCVSAVASRAGLHRVARPDPSLGAELDTLHVRFWFDGRWRHTTAFPRVRDRDEGRPRREG